jgi:hypothetical protein
MGGVLDAANGIRVEAHCFCNANAMPFKPDQSGNPAGKKPGTRHWATLLAQALIYGHAAEIWRDVIDRAGAVDPAMVKLCLERIAPRRRGSPSVSPPLD